MIILFCNGSSPRRWGTLYLLRSYISSSSLYSSIQSIKHILIILLYQYLYIDISISCGYPGYISEKQVKYESGSLFCFFSPTGWPLRLRFQNKFLNVPLIYGKKGASYGFVLLFREQCL